MWILIWYQTSLWLDWLKSIRLIKGDLLCKWTSVQVGEKKVTLNIKTTSASEVLQRPGRHALGGPAAHGPSPSWGHQPCGRRFGVWSLDWCPGNALLKMFSRVESGQAVPKDLGKVAELELTCQWWHCHWTPGTGWQKMRAMPCLLAQWFSDLTQRRG